MLKIRLRRMGKRHRPFFRVVVSDSRSVPAAPAVDEIGHYDPMTKPPQVRIDLERIEHWTGQGALMSPSVRKLVKGVRTGKAERTAEEKPAKKAAAAPNPAQPAPEPAAEEPSPAEEPRSEAVAETAGASDEAREPAVPAAAASEAAAAETPSETPSETQEEPEAEEQGTAAEAEERATDR